MSQDNEYQEDVIENVSQYMSGKRKFFTRIILCTIILLAGIGIWMLLRALKEPPAPADIPPPKIKVEVQPVCP